MNNTINLKKKRKASSSKCRANLILSIIMAFLFGVAIKYNFEAHSSNVDMKFLSSTGSPIIIQQSTTTSSSSSQHLLAPCSSEQKSIIQNQLPPNQCRGKAAYLQQCSLTKATNCPSQNWFFSYHEDVKNGIIQDTTSQSSPRSGDRDPFVAVYVGCNKGYDAVNALRMGSRNAKFNKDNWHENLNEEHPSICQQNESESEFPVSPNDTIQDAIVHCLEPMPSNVERLISSAKTLGWDDQLLVTKAAISKTTGQAYFPKSLRVGTENKGLASCDQNGSEATKKFCEVVEVYSLDHYMEHVAKKKTKGGYIDYLSIDVEGYDFDVMLGGQQSVSKTKYLEFEYNWMGSWANQKLMDAIQMLDVHGFTCYWAGRERAWRIDESCWLEHYDYHTWSNVACVNRNLLPVVARRMEETFQKTLKEVDLVYA